MSDPDRPLPRPTVTGRFKAVTGPHVSVTEPGGGAEVVVIVTQAYGPQGHSVIGISDVKFDGQPAVTLKLRTDGREGLIHLSPIHGDDRKQLDASLGELPLGAKCELFCPVSGQPLDLVGEVEDGSGARYFAIYLTPELSRGTMVMISDVWGHYHSRIIDDFELISAWAARHD